MWFEGRVNVTLPTWPIHPDDFVDSVGGMGIRDHTHHGHHSHSLVCVGESLAILEEGLEFPDISDRARYELMANNQAKSTADNFNFSDRRHIRALHRRYVEEFLQNKTMKLLVVNCVEVHDGY